MTEGFHAVSYDDGDKYRGAPAWRRRLSSRWRARGLTGSLSSTQACGTARVAATASAWFVCLLFVYPPTPTPCRGHPLTAAVGWQLNFADNSQYAGEFSNGVLSGFGVLTFSDRVGALFFSCLAFWGGG